MISIINSKSARHTILKGRGEKGKGKIARIKLKTRKKEKNTQA